MTQTGSAPAAEAEIPLHKTIQSLSGHFPGIRKKENQEPPAKPASILTADIRAEMSLWEEPEVPCMKSET